MLGVKEKNFWFCRCKCRCSNAYASELGNALAKALSVYIEKELPQDIKGRGFYCKQKLVGSLLEYSWQTFREEATRTSRVTSYNLHAKSAKDESYCVLWVFNDDKISSRDGKKMRGCKKRRKGREYSNKENFNIQINF